MRVCVTHEAPVPGAPATSIIPKIEKKGRSESIRSFPADSSYLNSGNVDVLTSKEPIGAGAVQLWLFGTVTVTVLVMLLPVLSVQVIVMV